MNSNLFKRIGATGLGGTGLRALEQAEAHCASLPGIFLGQVSIHKQGDVSND